jgi:hypothetical protein
MKRNVFYYLFLCSCTHPNSLIYGTKFYIINISTILKIVCQELFSNEFLEYFIRIHPRIESRPELEFCIVSFLYCFVRKEKDHWMIKLEKVVHKKVF